MKKSIFVMCLLISFLFLLGGCNFSNSTSEPEKVSETESTALTETEHSHQWQDISGVHARICTICNKKQLKSEACKFVRTSCDEPMQCEICHAIDNDSIEQHDWKFESESGDCWFTNVTYICSKCGMTRLLHGDYGFPYHSWSDDSADGISKFTCTVCGEKNIFISEIGEFSYAQVLEEFKIGDPGVKHENFKIPVEVEIASPNDAVAKAKLELTVEYDTISVSYDKEMDIWCVDFWTLNLDGGDQSVYLTGNGVPCYIIYGE